MALNIVLSDYYNTLDDMCKARYLQKIEIIGCDPFTLNNLCTDVSLFPKVTYGDIVNYLVFKRSAYSLNEFKAFKSLESYNQFLCGWVKEIGTLHERDVCVVVGKVLHSQRIREKPLKCWVLCRPDGEIISGHCQCVAGISETCSHIGAVLFTIDHNIQHFEERSVTGVKAYWKRPTTAGEPAAVKNIDFTSSKKLEKIAKGEVIEVSTEVERTRDIPLASSEEVSCVLQNLRKEKKDSALYLVIKPFCDEITHVTIIENPLSKLYNEKYESKDLKTLLNICANIDISITEEQCYKIEEITRKQAKCAAWFRHRLGRVTASNFKACVITKLEKPSISVIKNICYPVMTFFKSAATKYGCDHEKEAGEKFVTKMKKKHKNLTVSDVGFIINTNYPEVGASPDLLVNCDCCGPACLEIKCPFCAQGMTVEEASYLKNFCLKSGKNLDTHHRYYYQCQMQMAVSERLRCFFVIWTNVDLYVETIKFDVQFWHENYLKVKEFHKIVIMPELLGKFYTKNVSYLNEQKRKRKNVCASVSVPDSEIS